MFVIKKGGASLRLDKFIAKNWSGYSRAYLKKQIKAGQVLVSGKIKKSSYILKERDKVRAEIIPLPAISLEPDPSIKLNVIYEDNDVIVVNKPAGLTVHPSETQKSGTLVNALLAHYPHLKNIGDPSTSPSALSLGPKCSGQENLRPGLVHRLDKDTSGLMIIAKNNKAFEFLKTQFQQRKVEKKYLALVVGQPKKPSGEIKTFISRSKSDPTKQKVEPWTPGTPDSHLNKSSRAQAQGETPHRRPLPDDYQIRPSGAREAITLYKTLKKFKDYTLIEAIPKTGRMHQIRVHLAWLGCPVAGDKKYGPHKSLVPTGLKRQFLHASELTIVLPGGEKRTFTSPLPDDLQNILSTLENNK